MQSISDIGYIQFFKVQSRCRLGRNTTFHNNNKFDVSSNIVVRLCMGLYNRDGTRRIMGLDELYLVRRLRRISKDQDRMGP